MKILKLLLFNSFIVLTQITHAQLIKQDVIASGGDYFITSSNSLSWTLGECVTESFGSTANILTQGFQQSTYVITAIDENDNAEIRINVYPNPVNDHLNISLEKEVTKEFKIELSDVRGNLLHNRICFDKSTELEMSNYPSGVYLLKISGENQILKTFKIQKIN